MGTPNITPILDLDAIVPDRPVVLIRTKSNPEGKLWEFSTREELSIEELKIIDEMGKKIAQALPDGLTDEEAFDAMSRETAALLDEWLADCLRIAFHKPLDDETLESLRYTQKQAILEAFTQACLLPQPQNRQAKRKAATRKTTTKVRRTGVK